MDIKSAAQTVRDTVDMEQILSLYGYTTRRGFMVCPFHGDTDPSMKIYTGRNGHSGWHCFGCGRGGSVIDFVQEHEGCDFRTAVRAIDHACRLNLFRGDENPYDAEDARRIQEWLDDFVGAVNAYCKALRSLIELQMQNDLKRMKEARDKDVKDRTWEECMLLLMYDEESQYNEYRLEKIDGFREEVAAWRRKARRAGSASSRKT